MIKDVIFINVNFICNGASEGACMYQGKTKLLIDKILADWPQNTNFCTPTRFTLYSINDHNIYSY